MTIIMLIWNSWRNGFETIRKHESTGRLLGNLYFIEKVERLLDRALKSKKPGPKQGN
jgi:hypothetical protein